MRAEARAASRKAGRPVSSASQGELLRAPSTDGLPAARRVPSRRKSHGVVYTPDWVVAMMLDKLPSLKNVAVCDPACGDGQFLVAVAERVCRLAEKAGKVDRRAYRSTLRKLTGLDIDGAALAKCEARLNAVLKKHGCDGVDWNLREINALDKTAWGGMAGSFDAVVGNPPYVRIQHLEAGRRALINRGQWKLMSGCADMFILFFEMGLDLLRDGGELIYITPNSWMKSQSGASLRKCLRDGHAVRGVTDFAEHQVFDDATTYTAIAEVRKGAPAAGAAPGRKCTGWRGGRPVFADGEINLADGRWSVVSAKDARFLIAINSRRTQLMDVADISVGIQTLADDVFIMERGGVDLEEGATRKIMKASVMKNGEDRMDRVVIYPYDERGKLLPEEVLEAEYPKTYAYLKKNKERLLARDKGKIDPERWYGFGREVSIVSGFGEKILTSGMNRAPNFQRCPCPDSLFYSGYSVKPKAGVSLDALLDELNSDAMARYIRLVARPYRNGWYSYAKSFIKSFPVSDKVYA